MKWIKNTARTNFLRYMQVFPSPIRCTERGHEPFLPFSMKLPYREGDLFCALTLFYPLSWTHGGCFFERALTVIIFVLSSFWAQYPKPFLSLLKKIIEEREGGSETGQKEWWSVKKKVPFLSVRLLFQTTLLLSLTLLLSCLYAFLFVDDEMKAFLREGLSCV